MVSKRNSELKFKDATILDTDEQIFRMLADGSLIVSRVGFYYASEP